MKDTHKAAKSRDAGQVGGDSNAIIAFARDIPREVASYVSTLFWRMLTTIIMVMLLLTGGTSYYFSSRLDKIENRIEGKNRAIESVNRRHRDLVKAINRGDIYLLSSSKAIPRPHNLASE